MKTINIIIRKIKSLIPFMLKKDVIKLLKKKRQVFSETRRLAVESKNKLDRFKDLTICVGVIKDPKQKTIIPTNSNSFKLTHTYKSLNDFYLVDGNFCLLDDDFVCYWYEGQKTLKIIKYDFQKKGEENEKQQRH